MQVVRIQQALRYDPDNGEFTWIHGRHTHVLGKRAGNIQTNGYRYIHYCGTSYRACRLAWLFYFKQEPPDGWMVDHINRIRDDDRIANLRLATRSQNSANNSITMRGVYKHHNKWKAQLGGPGYLGLYDTQAEAYEAVKQAHKQYYGEFSSCE
jgi:hypothetical protein